MPQEIRSKMVYGFKVSQSMRRKNKRQPRDGLNESASYRSVSVGMINKCDKKDLRYSLKQYEELIMHMWRLYLDPENKQEISEAKFFRFLRENKILTEKKQLDEMYKQCLFTKKTEEVSVETTVPFALYQRLFQKPLMLIGMENALQIIELS